MAEYIEREAVENVIEGLAGGFDYIECGWKYAVEKIKEVPAADVVPVVRCNDCVFYSTQNPIRDGFGWCCNTAGGGVDGRAVSANFFCAIAEKREAKT